MGCRRATREGADADTRLRPTPPEHAERIGRNAIKKAGVFQDADVTGRS
eukprot:gene3698-5275_t